MPKACYLLTLLLLCVLFPLLAQPPVQPIRLELPFLPEDTEAEVIALPDSSLLVYHKTSNTWETKATFHFTKYDHKLEEVWSDTAKLNPDSDYIRYYTEQPYTYIVYGGDNLQKYTFLRLHNKTGNIWHKRFEIEQIEAIYEYNVLNGNYFVIGRSKKDQKPLLLHLTPASSEIKILPSVYGDQSTFSDLLADPEQGRVDAILTESNGRISRLQVKSFDAQGELLKNYFILQKDDKSLLNAEITPGDSTQKMLLGTYGTRDLRYNQGFFTAPLASRVVEGEFYNMLQLKNF
ncbi:recombinase family protein [Pontibacter rugosus]